jgi:hypothetical protein
MKLTREIFWDDNFINKFTSLRTSFLIYLTRILIDAKDKYHCLYDKSWMNTKINVDCSDLFKATNTHFSEDSVDIYNYYPHIMHVSKFGKDLMLTCRSDRSNPKYDNKKIKFEDGVKYILKKLFVDLKYDNPIELFRIEIKDFINTKNEKYKNELIEKVFKYLSDTYEFPPSIKFMVHDELYYIESVYKIYSELQNLYFIISFKVCSEKNDMSISFANDSMTEFNDFYKDLKNKAKEFVKKQKIAARIKKEIDKYL